MKRHATRAGAVLGAFTLAGMAMAPAMAAETVSQATANAVTLSVADVAADSGTVSATNDGTGQTKTGDTEPPIGALADQDLIDIGTLAQDAIAGVDGLDGVSAACAGVAGDDATLAQVGEGNCIEGGDNIGINIDNLDLTGTSTIDPESALGDLATQLEPLDDLLYDELLGTLAGEIADALAPLGNAGLTGNLGVVESRCEAVPGTATGTTRIVDGALSLTVGTQTFNILTLPVEPAPNTDIVTDLDAVLLAITGALRTDLEASLGGALITATELLDVTEQEIIDAVVSQVAEALGPIEENLLAGTLNKQTETAPGAIAVTGIDLKVLPAAPGPLLDVQIANVTCGPNGRLAAVTPPPAGGDDLPDVPSVVDSGVAGQEGSTADEVLAGGGVLLAMLAGLIGYRRLAAR